jgi:hypothetical protein
LVFIVRNWHVAPKLSRLKHPRTNIQAGGISRPFKTAAPSSWLGVARAVDQPASL